MLLKNELQNIISGTGKFATGDTIQTITSYLRKSKNPGTDAQKKEFLKEQEAAALLKYAADSNFFYSYINKERYLAEGAEQKVYLEEDNRYVIKVNGSIFYAKWEDYFHSLLLHNYFFPGTAYQLVGFINEDETLKAVVKQLFIEANSETDLAAIKSLMTANRFLNTKNNDYLNKDLGIILEDLHDENVLMNNGVLFFIDTVFYLTKDFFK